MPDLVDQTIHHPRTILQGVQAADCEPRSWLKGFPVCRALRQHQIVHLGIEQTRFPTRIVRTCQTTTYFLACLAGKGRVLIDGRWQVCRANYACLLPAHTLNAFEALPKTPWEFCWVCYQRPKAQRPIADAHTPVMAQYDPRPLRAAILGLLYECGGLAQPDLMQRWADLAHAYVLRFATASDQPDQLRLLWERVASHLAEEWTVARLAREAGYSSEHLRRMCLRQLGRSPMRQVTYLRMRRAAELLAASSQKLEAIAREVGYQNAFVFSNTFAKWIGQRPSDYRRKPSSRG